ncbi:PREDICTED: uncharacterized protein LOC107329387 isoform X2 [Acropora digitifera]|uniref:uncharacterized protein LOC107329387 isoform X2 n=1 Tax=Acropora digitifera TaxID=70779 RepID=UPI00077A0998|nr:PREDICTED: uncharacterized protein LOC107329387 isoform X2 [Acropora digitifera]
MMNIALISWMLCGILDFFRPSDGANLTWNEPLPRQVVPAVKDPKQHFSSIQLSEGTINATLRWNFSLIRLHFQAVGVSFKEKTVAIISPAVTGTRPPYGNRFGLDWIPNQNLVKLFIFNVTSDDNGKFSCQVTAESWDRFTEFHFTSNVEVDVVGTTSAPSAPSTASTNVERKGTTSAPSTTSSNVESKAGTPWAIIGGVTGSVVVLAIGVGVLTWWLLKQRKCRTDTKIHNSHHERDVADGQSGPPATNGTDGIAEQEGAVAGAIPTYVVVAKSKKEKKSPEEVPPVDAEEDKNHYETLDEPKKEKKPGEVLYADLGDFQNPSMPAVSISPQPLPAVKKADPYERTDYADITQFLKGNTTLPPNDGNGDTEMKPKRPSKRNIQGNDNETPI